MRRRCAEIGFFVIVLLFAAGLGAAADEGVGFTGSVGLNLTYTPLPPASFNIGSELALGFCISGFTFSSVTGFDLYGFQSEIVSLGVDLGAVQIANEVRFEPFFSWNALSVDVSIAGVWIGIDLILADIVGPPTPTYSMAGILELSSEVWCGVTMTSLTSFGAEDLVNMLGGIEAPISDRLLFLFNSLDTFCSAPAPLDVTVVPGFYFEEQLFRLEVESMGLLASNTTWFDETGLTQLMFELGYKFDDPAMAFLAAMSLDGGFVITGLDFILALRIDVVDFTSHTSFTEVPAPALLPIVFDAQRFAVAFTLCNVHVTTATTFDGVFLFAEQLIAIEAAFDPVTFKSLTTFDAAGFAGQCIYADVQFFGVLLYTQAEFDFSGVQLVTVGFELTFGI